MTCTEAIGCQRPAGHRGQHESYRGLEIVSWGERRRRRGKAQLRVEELLRWDAAALELARAGDQGALAAQLALACALRAGEITRLQVRDLDAGGTLLVVAESKTEAGRRAVPVPDHLQALLLELAGRRPRTELLFGARSRTWVWRQVARICELAKVPRVGPHSMRGVHASLSVARGRSVLDVAATLGHSSPSVTTGHYARPEAVAAGQQRVVLGLLRGGKR